MKTKTNGDALPKLLAERLSLWESSHFYRRPRGPQVLAEARPGAWYVQHYNASWEPTDLWQVWSMGPEDSTRWLVRNDDSRQTMVISVRELRNHWTFMGDVQP